jgi:hypothetical protein
MSMDVRAALQRDCSGIRWERSPGIVVISCSVGVEIIRRIFHLDTLCVEWNEDF